MRRKRLEKSLRRRSFAAGMTLIEAMAGVAVLGTVLTAILLADGRQRAQSARASLRLEACAIADEMLGNWWPKRSELPRQSGGDVPGHRGWNWRTSVVANEEAKEMNAEIVALEIFRAVPGASGPSEGFEDGQAAARVEILLTGRSGEEQ